LPHWGAYSALQTRSWILGGLLLRKEEWGGREGKVREGRERGRKNGRKERGDPNGCSKPPCSKF